MENVASAVGLTEYHAKYLAHELTRRCASDEVGKLACALADAQVDLNPHQVEAALFAFRSPFSKGAVLADEVGLGKTIEAGLLLSQRWAERKRRLLVIAPANLRKQWSQELSDKFHLPTVILEQRTFNGAVAKGNLNPFLQDGIVLCSYQFARSKGSYVHKTPWDLIVIDEAHRLRNVYKPSSKIALAIRDAIAPFPKLLLTATPLQNSLDELYGLVSFIDEYVFGELKSFRTHFARTKSGSDPAAFAELKERLRPLCKRTLRKQVLEYIAYTNRLALVQEFVPTGEEQKLYDLVSEYLQRPNLYALPSGQRQLMTLILRKLLASSTFAISNTLEGLAEKLRSALEEKADVEEPPEALREDCDLLEELEDEYADEEDDSPEKIALTSEQRTEMREEMEQLRSFHELARSIVQNSKGSVLLTALRKGFAQAAHAQEKRGYPTMQRKAVIFTESRRTQDYLFRLLEHTEFAGKIVLFNGTNADARSKEIFRRWSLRHAGTDRISGSPAADMRAALVECFRDEAEILIATEAAAEGLNLQFCNLVLNYDMPWNPQRIEQRIGRCHRYGQLFDVVVVNFLNKANAADVRTYDLLKEKFKLFDGVFGASDEVLGAVEAGVDFEKRIADIYQRCRTSEQIATEFERLQQDLETQIAEGQRDAREKLLDNFDQEVVEKVKVDSRDVLDIFSRRLWLLTRCVLVDHARFDPNEYAFTLHGNPFPEERIYPGPYRLGKTHDDENVYRLAHPLAQRVIERGKTASVPVRELAFDLSASGKNIAALAPFAGARGWLTLRLLTVKALEAEDRLVFAGVADDGRAFDAELCRRLFDLEASVEAACAIPPAVEAVLEEKAFAERVGLLESAVARDAQWFDVEVDKLDRWAEDQRAALQADLERLDDEVKTLRKEARGAGSMPERLKKQMEIRKAEKHRDESWRAYDAKRREIDERKENLLDDVASRLEQHTGEETLFTVRWSIA